MAEYKIQGETLTAIADAIREKKGTTAIFTPEQMAVEIGGIVTGDNLPNAEEASFGNVIDDGSNSRAFSTSSSFETDGNTLSANTFTWGFAVAEAFEIRAFQYYDSGYYLQNKTISMSDATGKVVFKYTWETVKAGWNEVVLNTPIVLLAGESYKVSSTSKRHSYLQKSKVIFDSRLTNITGTSYTTSGVIPTTYTIIAPVNFTIGTISELRPDSYQIERNTMDELADAIREKAGVEATISPEQMITIVDSVNLNLQEKTVTPSSEVQEIVPDDGYYGMSKVTVNAAAGTVLPDNIGTYYIGKADNSLPILEFNFTSSAVGTLN